MASCCVNNIHTRPAWNDADGGITFWAETEVEIRWAELKNKIVHK